MLTLADDWAYNEWHDSNLNLSVPVTERGIDTGDDLQLMGSEAIQFHDFFQFDEDEKFWFESDGKILDSGDFSMPRFEPLEPSRHTKSRHNPDWGVETGWEPELREDEAMETEGLKAEFGAPIVIESWPEYDGETTTASIKSEEQTIEQASAKPDEHIKSTNPALTPVGYTAFRQAQRQVFAANGKKKRGRPVGWRKDVHSLAAQGLAHVSKKGKSKARTRSVKKSKSKIPLVKAIMDEFLSESVKAEDEETIKIEPPENTFGLARMSTKIEDEEEIKIGVTSEPEETDLQNEIPDDMETEELQYQSLSTKDVYQGESEVSRPQDTSFPARDIQESEMNARFWQEVIEYSSTAPDSSTALERRDSVQDDCVKTPSGKITEVDDAAEAQAKQAGHSSVLEVLSRYELLERILLSMPMSTREDEIEFTKTVLLAQRVNKTCQHVIKRSAQLQQFLFSHRILQSPRLILARSTCISTRCSKDPA